MATLIELQAMQTALRTARYSGVRTLTHAGTTTEYKSDAEMAAADRALSEQIAALTGARASGVTVAAFEAD